MPAAEVLNTTSGLGYIDEKIDINDQIGIGIRKGDDELTNAFNAALETIRADGTYEAISDAYFGTDIY